MDSVIQEFLITAAALAAAQTRGEKPSEKTPLKTPGKIIDLILADPTLSLPEIALALSKSESAVNRAIRKLREDNLLRRVGPDKGGHGEVIMKE